MVVEFLAGNLEKHLPSLTKSLPAHSQVPILSNILLEANNQGFFMSSTDLEFGVKIKIPAKVEENGATTVPGRQFLDTLSMLSKDKVKLSLEKDLLLLTSANTNVSFQTISQEEYPTIIQEKGGKIHEFTKKEMEKTFSSLLFSVAVDDARPELTGILFSQKEEGLELASTDGFRLSFYKNNESLFEKDTKHIIPVRLIQEAMALKEKETVCMYIHEQTSQVVFESDETLLIGRLIKGDFPNYAKVIPQETRTSIILDREEFLQQVRLSSVFARESANIVYLTVKEGVLTIKAKSSGVGSQESTIAGVQEGEGGEIAFNAKFLIDLLKNCDTKEIALHMNSPVEPSLFTLPGKSEFLHVIMPVRVQE